MDRFTKIIAGLSVATLAALAMNAPAQAVGNNDWEDVGVTWYLDAGESERFDLPLEGGEYVYIDLESYNADANLCVVYPDGYTICSDEYGDDSIEIDTEYGGNFDIYVDNVDYDGTDFTLYVEYA
mgnify:CR=1 FL=1